MLINIVLLVEVRDWKKKIYKRQVWILDERQIYESDTVFATNINRYFLYRISSFDDKKIFLNKNLIVRIEFN